MITKERLRNYIDRFPDEISIDELIDRLVFIDKLEIRITESDNNDVVDEEDVKAEMEKWFR